MITIRQTNVFQGPSIWSQSPVIQLTVDLGELEHRPAHTIPCLVDQLISLMPELGDHYCLGNRPGDFAHRIHDGTRIWHVIRHVALALQDVGSGELACNTSRPGGQPTVFHVVYGFDREDVGQAAGQLAIRLVNHLIHSTEPDFDLARERTRLITRPIERSIYGSYTSQEMVAEAKRRGIPVRPLPRRSLVQLGNGVYQRRIWSSDTSNTSNIGARIASRKDLTIALLREVGLPVPDGVVVDSADDAVRGAERIGYPVVLKPRSGNHSNGVCLNLRSEADVRQFFPVAARQHELGSVIVERFIPGRNYRVTVVNNHVVAVHERVRPAVVGDGSSTVRHLVAVANDDPRRTVNPYDQPSMQIPTDSRIQSTLEDQRLSLDAVPERGRRVELTPAANVNVGVLYVDRTDDIHTDNVLIAELAARVIGLDVAGIDIVTPDIAQSIRLTGGAINEVNSGPDTTSHEIPNDGLPRRVCREILETLYPPGQPVRVPVVAVVGSTATSALSHMIAHQLSIAGNIVGLAAENGLFLDGALLQPGDRRHAEDTEKVLNNPMVDHAVFETSPGDILRSGLRFSPCDVAVVTSLANDDTELIRACTVVPAAVHDNGATIINADDNSALDLVSVAGGRIVLISTADDNPTVRDHVRQDGRAVVLRRSNTGPLIAILEPDRTTNVLPASAVPALANAEQPGAVINVLAMTAVGLVLDIQLDRIRQALRSYTENDTND